MGYVDGLTGGKYYARMFVMGRAEAEEFHAG
jgi:hypothetical protein